MHEQCLRMVYHENTSSYEELLKIDNSVSVHHRNIQILASCVNSEWTFTWYNEGCLSLEW